MKILVRILAALFCVASLCVISFGIYVKVPQWASYYLNPNRVVFQEVFGNAGQQAMGQTVQIPSTNYSLKFVSNDQQQKYVDTAYLIHGSQEYLLDYQSIGLDNFGYHVITVNNENYLITHRTSYSGARHCADPDVYTITNLSETPKQYANRFYSAYPITYSNGVIHFLTGSCNGGFVGMFGPGEYEGDLEQINLNEISLHEITTLKLTSIQTVSSKGTSNCSPANHLWVYLADLDGKVVNIDGWYYGKDWLYDINNEKITHVGFEISYKKSLKYPNCQYETLEVLISRPIEPWSKK
jgi:hypothetical protein